jgi:hypothetical protein
MAVEPVDLKEPQGSLNTTVLFPGETAEQVDARLTAYIAEAVAKGSPDDDATRAWTYHRAFNAVYIRMSANPVSVTANEEGGHRFGEDQAKRFLELSQHYLAIWTSLLVEVPIRAATPSGHVKTVFTW